MKWFHKHKWNLVDVRHVREYNDFFGKDRLGTPLTEMLLRCECGKTRVGELGGLWTKEQLLGKPK